MTTLNRPHHKSCPIKPTALSRYWLHPFLCILTLTTAYSQILPFKTYSVKDGLLSNDIEAIAQDSYGRMWFGTTEGVSVYDGRTFTSYTTRDSLRGNFVNQILPDRKLQGVVWIVAGGGLCRFNNDSLTPIHLNAGGVTSIHQDNRGVLWCGTDVGVFTIDGDSVTRFEPQELNDQIEHIAEVGDSVLWFSHGPVLLSYSRATGRFDRLDCKPFGNGNLWNLFADRRGVMYALMGTSAVVSIRNGNIEDIRWIPEGPIDAAEDNEGNLWFGGYGGIAKVSADQFPNAPFQHFTTVNGLLENTVRCLYIDREQNLWVGGRDKGLAKLSAGYSMRFPLGYLWYWYHHRIAVADSNSHLWIVSDYDLLEVWRDRFQIWHSLKHGLYNRIVSKFEYKNGEIGGVALDGLNRLWITRAGKPSWVAESYEIVPSRDAGLVDDQPSILKRIRAISLPKMLDNIGIFSIIASKTGEIWVTSNTIIRLDPRKENPIVRIYPENYSRELFEDRHGNIWAGSLNDGAVKIAVDGQIRRYTTADGLPDNGVWAFAEDGVGRMLIGTSNGGLAMLDGDSITVLSQREGLPSNKIFCATRDSSGRLWLGTSIGMVYEDRPGSKSFIKNQAFIGSGAICAGTTRSGLLWFITPTDLWVYDYSNDHKDTIPPPVYINQLHVNGVPRAIEGEVRLAHYENNCEVSFVGVSFTDENPIRYLYRLVGSDQEWQGPTENTSITYGHLDPGAFTFEVKAISIDGVESVNPASIAISVFPPYWRTWWFYTLVVVSLSAVMALVHTSRTRRLRREQRASQEFSRELIESQEAERKRVAGELHDGLGQELMVIMNRSQLALKAQTIARVKEQLNEITQTTSRAIADVREMAYNLRPFHLEQLGLTDSIRTMVEKMAGLSAIQFSIDIDRIDSRFSKNLEINLYRIIQECVNNIVKHSKASHADVIIKNQDDQLEIIARDDGVGFDVATGGVHEGKRRGFGLAGLRERVTLLNGSLSVTSSAGKGTTIGIAIPYGNSTTAQSPNKSL